MDLVVLYRALLRKKWIIFGISIFAVLLALFLTRNYKQIYKSTAQLSTGFTVPEQVSVTNERFNLFEADVKFNNLIETINSPIVFSLLSYKLILHDLRKENIPFRIIEETGKINEVLNGKSQTDVIPYFQTKFDSLELLSTYNPNDVRMIDLLKLYEYDLSSLRDIIHVGRIRGTDYLSIEAYSENPDLSAFIVNTLTQVFLDYNRSLKNERSFESVKNFASLVEQKREEMKQKSDALQNFKASNKVLNFDIESSSIIGQISSLENKRDEESRNVQNLRYELNDLSDRINKLSGSASSGNSNASKNSEIIELREKISNVNSRFIASGSTSKVLLDSLSILRSMLQQKLIQSGSSPGSSNDEIEELMKRRSDKEVAYEISRANLNSINNDLRELKNNASEYSSIENTISSLQRELNIATQEYQAAQQKYNTALDVAMSSTNNIRQVLKGQPADEPEPSKRIIITGLSGLSVFILCIIVFVFIEYIDISAKTPSNFKRLSNTNHLGAIISFDLNKNDLVNVLTKNPVKKEFTKYLENIRKLRYEIETSSKKVFLITSTIKGQGKTTLIISLAFALSKVNRKILIIDANFSDNSITHIFRAYPTLERIGHETGKADKIISQTNQKNIHIIGSKGGNYSPSEILPADNFLEYLNCLKSEYDFIFMEGAGLNDYPDSKELEPFAEGIIAVFSAKSVFRQNDRDSYAYLSSLGNKFLGTVLNNVEAYNLDQ